ncbi:MAG: hypothetical protein K2W95_09880 [Candidatus Obscuribacterales bacterium]|nr:hypothetical protein [Candidatus Obscuribacterales bacterium]
MLFSNPQIASYINDNFVPVWHSVRPVPILKVDFGNGRVVTRTLQGNIATYVCSPQGTVIDALPGIYDAQTYRELLGELQEAASTIAPTTDTLHAYHQNQAEGLKPTVSLNNLAKFLGSADHVLHSANQSTQKERDEVIRKNLQEDSRLNRTVWRLATHELLARVGQVRPEDINKQFYREILHTDLDDPYLGLGDTLFCDQ